MKETKLNKTAIYCRLSQDDGMVGDSSSIQTQKMMLEQFVKDNNFVLYDIYVDDGYTGLNYNRPGFQRLLEDIENGKKGDIIVLAGKGHEDYQEIKGVKYPMDERVLIKEILEK